MRVTRVERYRLLLGDNGDASTDSRSWHNPYVSRDEVVGILIRRGDRMMARQSPSIVR